MSDKHEIIPIGAPGLGLGSTRVVGLGDSVRVIKLGEFHMISERDPRTGQWSQWVITDNEHAIAAYDEEPA
jgi:hypothetical protein